MYPKVYVQDEGNGIIGVGVWLDESKGIFFTIKPNYEILGEPEVVIHKSGEISKVIATGSVGK